MNYKVIFQGNFYPKNIHIHHTLPSFQTDEFIETQIKKNWHSLSRNDRPLFDGKNYRLEKFSILDSGDIKLGLSTISYKQTVGIPLEYVAMNGKEANFPLSLCCTILLQTQCGNFLFGKRDSKHLLVGGSYSLEEVVLVNGKHIFDMPMLELKQEVGLSRNHISSSVLKGGLITNKLNAALLFHMKCNKTREEIEEIFHRSHDQEFDEIVFVRVDELKEYFQINHPNKLEILSIL